MILFENDSTNAAFWFAAEEYVMRCLKPDEPVLMLWSTGDTIMVGANQVVDAEVDRVYAKKEMIEIVRRSSGGGTIFTDKETLQYTIILPHNENVDHKAVIREQLTEPVLATLARFGVIAVPEGRNDIMIDGKKISGLAQYIKDGYLCSHGSLLFKTDLEKLAKCLTVDNTKILTKAIASVRVRVANISDYIAEQDMEVFREALIETYAAPCKKFDANQHAQIEHIMNEKYLNPEWTYGHEPAFTYTNKKRFPGGLIEVFLDVKGGTIQSARINGDFLSLRPVSELEAILKDVPHQKDALIETLSSIDVMAYLGSLSVTEFLEVLL